MLLDAIELQKKAQLSFWDALIVQAALDGGASTVPGAPSVVVGGHRRAAFGRFTVAAASDDTDRDRRPSVKWTPEHALTVGVMAANRYSGQISTVRRHIAALAAAGTRVQGVVSGRRISRRAASSSWSRAAREVAQQRTRNRLLPST
jgi:hypothetical protein